MPFILFTFFLLFAEEKLSPFKSGKNKGMNYFERFDHIESHLLQFDADYRSHKKSISRLNKEIKLLGKTLQGLQEQISQLKKKMDQHDGDRFRRLEKKVDRIDNQKLDRIHIKLRGMKSRINALEQSP